MERTNLKRTSFITFNPKQWIIIVVGLTLCCFFAWISSFSVHGFESFIMRLRYAESMQREFGYKAEWRQVKYKNQTPPPSVLVITYVDPNGIFAKSGIKAGDIPFLDGERMLYWKLLDYKKGKTVELWMSNVDDFENSLENQRSVKLIPTQQNKNELFDLDY